MFLKILVTLILVVVAWTVAVRLTGPKRPRKRLDKRDRRQDVPAAMKCANCGIYLPPGQSCRCGDSA